MENLNSLEKTLYNLASSFCDGKIFITEGDNGLNLCRFQSVHINRLVYDDGYFLKVAFVSLSNPHIKFCQGHQMEAYGLDRKRIVDSLEVLLRLNPVAFLLDNE